MLKDLVMISHVILGILAVAVVSLIAVDALNITEANTKRIRAASVATTVFAWLSYLSGGYYYVHLYGPHKAIIKAGPKPWVQYVIMEVKEHIFFVFLILSIYLTILVFSKKLLQNKGIRNLIILVAVAMVILGLAIGVFGVIITKTVELGTLGG